MLLNKAITKSIKNLCKNYRVKTLSIFGSATRDDFNEESDIDFAVDFEEKDPIVYADLYFNFKRSLEELFNREVDLIESRAIRNSYFKDELEKTQVNLYG